MVKRDEFRNRGPIMTEVVQDSWWQRNWKWFVPVGCFGFLVLALAGFAMLFALILGGMRNAEVTQLAISIANNDAALVEAIGEPIEPRGFINGSISISGPSGEADLAIPVVGPRGRATLYGEATRRQSEWSYDVLVAELEADDRRLDLLR
ncbi:MAG: hypothetical protein EA418_00840 [Wenzhouxiangellaceae bacterium]|nr:MAG: hypothetical protein EA418_00840 [Wenzhouxiangellaceae bacterium]